MAAHVSATESIVTVQAELSDSGGRLEKGRREHSILKDKS